jgi:hypothetical protein
MNLAEQCRPLFPKSILIDGRRVLSITYVDTDDDDKLISLNYMVTDNGSLIDDNHPAGHAYADATLIKEGKQIAFWKVRIPHHPSPQQVHEYILADLNMEI